LDDVGQNPLNSLANIATSATERGLQFLLAGGHAVIAHGYARNTFDIDIIIPRDQRDAWCDLAKAAGYSLYHEGPTFIQFDSEDRKTLPLDIMLVSEGTFSKLMADSVPAPESAASARIVSLSHLISLKCHAIKHGHQGRVMKDMDDVFHLVEINRLNLTEPAIRDLILKHGTPELYEKLKGRGKGE
jgi:hypothetical protein